MISLKMFARPFGARKIKDSLKGSCAFAARILSSYTCSYVVKYKVPVFFYAIINLGSWKRIRAKQVTLTMVVQIEFCLDIWFLLSDIYEWAHWENLGRTFRKEVRPWAQGFVWPNASLGKLKGDWEYRMGASGKWDTYRLQNYSVSWW